MSVTREDVQYIATLAKLKFEEKELDILTVQMNKILSYMEKLNELDTENVEPLAHPIENQNVFRKDKIIPSKNRSEALKNAPKSTDEFFVVPKVIKN